MATNDQQPTPGSPACARRRHRGMFLPVILIVLGVGLLAYKSDPVAREAIANWWPLVFVLLGIWLAAVRWNR